MLNLGGASKVYYGVCVNGECTVVMGFQLKLSKKAHFIFKNRVWSIFGKHHQDSSRDSSHLQTLIFKLPLEGTSPEGPSPGAQRAILKVYAQDESYSAEGGLDWGDLTFRDSEMPFSAFSARHFQ